LPTPIGLGPLFHPVASNPSTDHGLSIGPLACSRSVSRRFGVHLELFAHGRVVVIPAAIGISPPLRRTGAYVVSGTCSYPVRTREPTGVIEVARSRRLTLGDFFAVWQKPLSDQRLLNFRTSPADRVRTYVAGRRYRGAPAALRLHRHAEIVLEIGKYVPPHVSYRFRGGL